MKFRGQTPKNIEIKRTSCGEWEPGPDGAVVQDRADGSFLLTESDGKATDIYDVRDERGFSWRDEITRRLRNAHFPQHSRKFSEAIGDMEKQDDIAQEQRLQELKAEYESGQKLLAQVELVFLRRTIGSAPWLDALDDEQWRVLYNEILPALHKAELARGTRGAKWQEA